MRSKTRSKHARRWTLLPTISLALSLLGTAFGTVFGTAVHAADHRESPALGFHPSSDIGDAYFFLDPNDNGFAIAIVTSSAFIVPGESENLGFFQEKLNYRFAFETTGDAYPEYHAEVTFSKRTDPESPQVATVRLRRGSTTIGTPFTAPTTVSSATSSFPPEPVVTKDPASNISFYAGMTDDPFFFDVPAELLFRASLIESDPIPPGGTTAPGARPEVFDRGIDTFAGFNVMAVALRIPLALLETSANPELGLSVYTERTQYTVRSRAAIRDIGAFVNVDRMGIPGINTILTSYGIKDRYNRGWTAEDAAGFFADDITARLGDLKTNSQNTATLLDLAVATGDHLRLDTRTPNSGPEGGTSLGAGFPNGRRLTDDPMDTLVNLLSNGLFDDDGIVDNVNSNDKPFLDVFPFLAPPHQPAGLIDPAR